MKKTVLCTKLAKEDGTIHDTLSRHLDEIRKEGFSIFGINEYDNVPRTSARQVEIFYE